MDYSYVLRIAGLKTVTYSRSYITHPSFTLSSGGPTDLHHTIQAADSPDNLLMSPKFNLFISQYRNLRRKKIMSNEKVQNVIIQKCGLLIRSEVAATYVAYLFPPEHKFCSERL